MGRDSCSKGRGFKSRYPILDGYFFTYICCKNCNACLKRQKINEKEAGVGPFKKKEYRDNDWQRFYTQYVLNTRNIGHGCDKVRQFHIIKQVMGSYPDDFEQTQAQAGGVIGETNQQSDQIWRNFGILAKHIETLAKHIKTMAKF